MAIVCQLSFVLSGYAQTETTEISGGLSNVTVHGGMFAGANLHSANFSTLPSLPNCCVTFSDRMGLGGAAVVGAEYDLSSFGDWDGIRLGGNLSYSLLTGALRETEFVGNIIRGSDVTRGITEHRLAVTYGVLAIEPYVSVALPIHGLRVNVGLMAGLPLSPSFEFRESLVQPMGSEWTFENGGRERNNQEGPLQDTEPLYLAATFGLRYDISTNRRFELAPTVQYAHAFTNVVTDTRWSIDNIRVGVLFRMRLEKPAPPPPPPPP
ncbi:MAG TPA: hypothetical protein PLW14_11045, partial [Chlorobiota bacterium]|nr:hypothetical protein [Chlorobiota bacterium]